MNHRLLLFHMNDEKMKNSAPELIFTVYVTQFAQVAGGANGYFINNGLQKLQRSNSI